MDYLTLHPPRLYALPFFRSLLEPDLSTGDTFIIEVIPPQGAVLHIERTAPIFIESFNDLN